MRRAEVARGAGGRGVVDTPSSASAFSGVVVVVMMPISVGFLLLFLFSSRGMSVFVDFPYEDDKRGGGLMFNFVGFTLLVNNVKEGEGGAPRNKNSNTDIQSFLLPGSGVGE